MSRLSNEEIVSEIQKGHNREKNLELLYQQNKELIRIIAKKYAHTKEDLEDLQQEAYLAVERAASIWKNDAGASFSWYLSIWVRQAILRYNENNSTVVRIPSHQRQRMQRYKRAVDDFQKELGRMPTSAELVSVLDISYKQLENVITDAKYLTIASLDKTISGESEDIRLSDAIPDPEDPIEGVLDKVQREQLAVCLWSIVAKLSKDEQLVLWEKYKNGKTQAECGRMLGKSHQRAQQIEAAALRKLRTGPDAEKLASFLTESDEAGAYHIVGARAYQRTRTSITERIVLQRLEREH